MVLKAQMPISHSHHQHKSPDHTFMQQEKKKKPPLTNTERKTFEEH
jgi:hypothetical protein